MKLDDLRVTITVAVCITAAALTAISANAHERDATIDLGELKAEAEARFTSVDTDGDAVISMMEFEAADNVPRPRMARDSRRGRWMARGNRGDEYRADVFTEADTDDDEQLSKAEFEAVPAAIQRLAKRRLFNRLDENDDASLSADEFPSRYNQLARLDANSDGQVTHEEMPRRHRRGHR